MNFSAWILKLFRWKPVYEVIEPPKSVICVAPHTSNWDFIIGKLFAWAVGLNAGFLMKKSWFVFPLGYVFKAMGGVPIDRSKKNSVVQQMIETFEYNEKLHLAITPEGTRRRHENWKLGFYYIALGAKVPIQLAYINFKNKEMGIREVFYPTGNESEDLNHIYDFYRKNGVPKKEKNFAIPLSR